MSHQFVTPELRRWILSQAEGGYPVETVLKSMIQAGWDEKVAVEALESTLKDHLKTQRPDLVPPEQYPEPHMDQWPSRIFAHDREVDVLLSMKLPRVVLFGNFLSEQECDELVAMAASRLERSHTVQTSTGGSELNEARTSEGMFFERGENELCARIEARIAALVRWPVINGEGLQVLHYGPGAEYQPHYDYFDPKAPGTPTLVSRGGQRVGTLVMYLNTPTKGGGTSFPDVGVEVAPIKGNAVFFSYLVPDPATKSLHGGSPVIEGEKWVATKWMRLGEFR